MSKQLVQLLEEATCEDDIHDVEFIVSYTYLVLSVAFSKPVGCRFNQPPAMIQ